MVDGYRRWLARHRDNSVVRLYEKLAVWMLERSVGDGEVDEGARYQLWVEAHQTDPRTYRKPLGPRLRLSHIVHLLA